MANKIYFTTGARFELFNGCFSIVYHKITIYIDEMSKLKCFKSRSEIKRTLRH